MKRLMDLFTALLVLVLFLPFGILISLLIVLESSGGLFYRQERIGLKGKPFYLLKFRSMRPNADLQGKLTVGERDPRVTRIGFFIRKFKLDEFPQFINVFKGEMSVVGPRPEVAEYVALYSENQRRVLDVKPGITDEASITYFEENKLLSKSTNPHKTYIEEIMPEKIRINLAYQERATVWTDLGVVWKTAARMVK
ncbi:MAG: sugar transferase [Flavobacteriales bacterium]|jgi:lipopolysaccharide/colanic/teichoic acid biosynthesis glycosyltransferase